MTCPSFAVASLCAEEAADLSALIFDKIHRCAGVYSLPQRSNNHITCAPPSTTQWPASPASPSPWGGALQPNKRGYYYYCYYLFYYLFVFYANPLPSSIPPPLNLHNRQVDDCVADDEEILIEGGQVDVLAEEVEEDVGVDLSAGVVCKKYGSHQKN